MFIRITTWTIFIFLLIIPTFSYGAVIGGDTRIIEVKELKTMYDVVVKKCHNLEATDLKDNEIFTKKCLNWAEINATNSFNMATKYSVQCLVFYEALVSFCTGMGDSLINVQGLIPTTADVKKLNYSGTTICSGGTNNLYPLNKTEHNLASLVPKIDDCMLLCLDFSGVADICKYAYYFTNLNISKITGALNRQAAHKNPAGPIIGPAPESGKVNLSIPTTEINKTQEITNQLPINQVRVNGPNKIAVPEAAPVPVAKPEHTEKGNLGLNISLVNSVTKEGLKLDDKPKVPEKVPESDTEHEIQKPPVVQQLERQKPTEGGLVDPPAPGNKIVANGEGAPQVPLKPSQVEKSPETAADAEKEKKVEQEYPIVGNPASVDVDGTDQELDEENDLDAEDGDNQDKHGMPVENNDMKTPPKKGKPSTVEDEAVSSFNAPEDDMNGDSYFFSYFTVIMCLVIVGYVGYHNRQKILALILEGKKGRRPGRGRRPNSANYHKLDTNLEEAISSSCTKTASNVIY